MSKPDNNDQKYSLTDGQKQAIQQEINKVLPGITAKIIKEYNATHKHSISDGSANKQPDIDVIVDVDIDTDTDTDDPNFAPLDDYDAEEKSDEADEDRLAREEEREEADEEPDDDSPDYNRWSQDQQTEDEAMANGVDSPGGWAGADLDPDWETGHDQTDDNGNDNDDDLDNDDSEE